MCGLLVTSILPSPHAWISIRLERQTEGAHTPIPSRVDIERYLQSQPAEPPAQLEGIDLRPEAQRALLRDYAAYASELPFPEQPAADFRYYYENDFFSYADAIFLYSFLRHFHPRRVVEVGSGFSSALMLDTAERFLDPPPQFIFIEPFPEQRLEHLLRQTDRSRVTILRQPLQATPLEVFRQLDGGDLLFIDSSHVLKCGSDVQRLLFEILPALPSGVFVHFHDVFYPFEYPAHWLREGRYWNEDYFLRAFLYANALWEVVFFNTYVAHFFRSDLETLMPLCLRNPGGSLYLRRK
ncbi:MAG: class I SAM-dependent methyltransferase [Candidatus Sumerlaeaceae bacterium]